MGAMYARCLSALDAGVADQALPLAHESMVFLQTSEEKETKSVLHQAVETSCCCKASSILQKSTVSQHWTTIMFLCLSNGFLSGKPGAVLLLPAVLLELLTILPTSPENQFG